MYAKQLKRFTSIFLFVMVCVLGYTLYINAQQPAGEGTGYECQGAITPNPWNPDCNNLKKADCTTSQSKNPKTATKTITSTKRCVHTGNNSDYCRMTTKDMRSGTGNCDGWNSKKNKCSNPSLSLNPVPDC